MPINRSMNGFCVVIDLSPIDRYPLILKNEFYQLLLVDWLVSRSLIFIDWIPWVCLNVLCTVHVM